jgi:hypothetical protein
MRLVAYFHSLVVEQGKKWGIEGLPQQWTPNIEHDYVRESKEKYKSGAIGSIVPLRNDAVRAPGRL